MKSGRKLKLSIIKNKILENADLKERVTKGLDMTFEKLIKTKIQTNDIFVFSQNGIIRKEKAAHLHKKLCCKPGRHRSLTRCLALLLPALAHSH